MNGGLNMVWHVHDIVETFAGRVASGNAGHGPPLVLAHGWPWSSYSWHRIIPSLAQHYRVHWFDMPGFGKSGKSLDRKTSLDVQGGVFVEMLAYWKLERPTILAHDIGGAVTLRAHLLHGAEYEYLTLMNVVALRPWGSAFFGHVKKHIDAFAGACRLIFMRGFYAPTLRVLSPIPSHLRMSNSW